MGRFDSSNLVVNSADKMAVVAPKATPSTKIVSVNLSEKTVFYLPVHCAHSGPGVGSRPQEHMLLATIANPLHVEIFRKQNGLSLA